MKGKMKFLLKKIPLEPFIDALLEAYEDGAMFIDIAGSHSDEQDELGILVKDSYFTKGTTFCEEDINQLI